MLANAELAVNLFVQLVFGGICAAIAHGRGRSAVGWFFIGFLIACIGLILLLVLPDLRVEQERQQRTRLENRRLREQIAKERQIADLRHSQVEQRLGVHDRALGVDTSQPPALPGRAAPEITTATEWFYARDDEQLGPVSEETLRHLFRARAIDPRTLVWTEGMDDWLPLGDVDDLQDFAS